MAATKKVFFGSLFEFSSAGTEEILEGIRDHFSDPEVVPFVSYDAKTNLFSFEVGINDQDLIPIMIAQIESYIALYGRTPKEPLESDRLKAIEGTVFTDEVNYVSPQKREPNPLFDITDASSDEEKPAEDQNIIYWKPDCGDIFMMSKDLVAELTDATGCLLVPYPAEQKVRLAQGNPNEALEKLQRLEHVLNISQAHRTKSGSRANVNLLISSNNNSSTVKFIRPIQPLCGFDRVLLHPAQVGYSNQLMLGEARMWANNQHIKPVNLDLDNVSVTASTGVSAMIGRAVLPTFGNAKNAEPRPPSNENSQLSGELQRVNSPTKFLGHKDTERVEEWRGNVDLDAAPTLPPVEPDPELELEIETKPGRRRLIESDSESDDETDNAPKQVKHVDSSDHTTKQKEIQRADDSYTLKSDPGNASPSVPDRLRLHIQAPATKPALKTSNMFAMIDLNDDSDEREMESEMLKSDQSSENVKHLNVTFEEPETDAPPAPLSMRQSTSPAKFHKPNLSPFDEAQYGFKKHTARSHSEDYGIDRSPARGKGRGGGKAMPSSRMLAKSELSGGTDPFQPSPRRMEPRPRQSGLRGGSTSNSQRRQRDLIDVVDGEASDKPVLPPPGFEYRSADLIRQGLEPTMSPSKTDANGRARVRSSAHGMAGSHTPSARELVIQPPGPQEFNAQYTVPRRNMNYIQNRALTELAAQMNASDDSQEAAEQEVQVMSPNRISSRDEHKSRKYHNTMSQKTAKPGKGKATAGKQETKAQKDARIAKVKAELYGDTKAAKTSVSKPQAESARPDPADVMSARKRQLIKKNPKMADLHQDVVAENAAQNIAAKLVEELKPILEATRVFKGVVKVEVQLGQAIVLKSGHIDEGRLYKPKEWSHLLNGKNKSDPKVIFTNILTTNGQDIDRMLEIKAETEPSKLWHKSHADTVSTAFEFTCEDKTGDVFLFVLDQNGTHCLNKPESTIAQIALHAPDQIWDSCVVVSGTSKLYRPSDEILAGVEQFKESLYIPGGQKAAVYFRLPPNNAFTVRAIVVKRVSAHECLSPSRHGTQLRITEVKVLAHSSHPTDKKLYRSYESTYDVMIAEGRLHYEVAIVDRSIEKAFENNPDIDIGEKAPISTASGTILCFAQAQGLVEVTSHMLKQIDWVGAQNLGTLRRLLESTAEQRALMVSTLPPNINRSLHIPMGTTAPPTIIPPPTQSQQHSRTGSSGNNNNVNTNSEGFQTVVRRIHGVRSNTAAELYQDASTGELFYYGVGGARIPIVPTEDFESLRLSGTGPVVPGDSASQIGDVRKKLADSVKAKNAGAGRDDKPAGFW